MAKSFRTSILGVLLILGALINAATAYLDDDPLTNVDLKATGAVILGGVAAIKARDQKAHEEDVKARGVHLP